jgi:hypothetical protein
MLFQGGKGSWARQAAFMGGLLCFVVLPAGAQSFSVSGSPVPLVINTAIAGLPPTDDQDATTTYTVKAQNRNKPIMITARLNAAMPPGMTLTLTMDAPNGATSNGPVTLDASAREIVGEITNTNAQTRGMTYVVSATAAAGVVPPQSRTVTLTVAAWP